MVKYSDEYNIPHSEPLKETHNFGNEVDELIYHAYSEIAGESFCFDCEQEKFYNDRDEEYLCPICEAI